MKIPDIGDVMNKFEVLGIVGEGKSVCLNLDVTKCNNNSILYVLKDV